VPRDEVFHGSNPTEGVALTDEVVCVDTLMHSGHRAHGGFRLHYSDTVLTTGNGRMWADWAVTGLRPGVLFGLPYVGFLSQRHRLPLVFGWLEATLEIGGETRTAYRVISWTEADAIPVSHFSGGAWEARAWCSVIPGEARLLFGISVTGVAEGTLVLRGGSTLGEEAGSPHDAVNGTVGSHERLPAELTAIASENGLVLRNEAAGLGAHLTTGAPCEAQHAVGEVSLYHPDGAVPRPYVTFELRCPLQAMDDGSVGVVLELALSEHEADAPAPSAMTVSALSSLWRGEWACLEPLQTPDALLTAGLRRAAIYAASMLAPIDGTDESAGLSDHIEWPVDCARDTFHVASALLFLRPDLARRHLAFTYLDAIPRAGAGKSYVATGESRGHREARLLDLAAYPLLELWRYWRATADDVFVAQPRVQQTALRLVDEVRGWQDPRTGLFTSTERSSDEPCVYPCFIPGNAMFCVCLEHVAELCEELWGEAERAGELRQLAARLRQAIWDRAVVDDPEFGRMFAFEVGGPGEALLYDHADMPNLLSLARLGFCAADDPVWRSTVRFAYSDRNQGFRGTRAGKYRQLCDGSKTMPFSPWPLGALGQLMSGTATPTEAAQLLDWLRDALTPALQLPEISDRHTARPVQRYWFGWPTAMLAMAFVETICGVKIGREVTVEPLIPEGWESFRSPILTVRGRTLRVVVEEGVATTLFDGRVTPSPSVLPRQ